MKEALVYLVAIAAAEVINVTVGPVWGIVCHIIVLVALILRSALADKRVYQQLPLSLALVPLVRIISLSMPLANIPPIWWYPIIYAPLLVAAWQVVRLQGYSLGQIGLNLKRVPIQLAVALTGTVFGIGEYFILTEEAQMTGLVLQQTWLLSAFLLIVCTGFVEEFFLPGFAWSLVFLRKISVLERIVLSLALSIVVVTLSLLFANVIVGTRITGFNSVLIIILVTILPVLAYYLNKFIRRRRGKTA
jgi:hypothetical protein